MKVFPHCVAAAALLAAATGCTPVQPPLSGSHSSRPGSLPPYAVMAETVPVSAVPPAAITPENLAGTMVAVKVISRQKVSATFHICRYEATQSLWEAVMGDNPSQIKGADLPVDQVSWNDVQDFLRRLNAHPAVKASGISYRLPTDVEWTHACQAGADPTNDFGMAASGQPGTVGEMCWCKGSADGHSHGVGQKAPNALGLYDMHGNVREWTATTEGFFRVIRGGGWRDIPAWCTTSKRFRFIPEVRNDDLGFRLAY